MKQVITMFFMLIVCGLVYAQSTCMSRCEEVRGIGDISCPKICEDHPDGSASRIKKNKANAIVSNDKKSSTIISTQVISSKVPETKKVDTSESGVNSQTNIGQKN